jgi:hypothetical protein
VPEVHVHVLAAGVVEDRPIPARADLVEQLFDRYTLAASRCPANQDVISLGVAENRDTRQREVVGQFGGFGERDHRVRGSERRPADMLVFGRRTAALAQEVSGRNRPADRQ